MHDILSQQNATVTDNPRRKPIMGLHLFGHPDSGHAFKVRFLLSHAAVEHDYSVIDIFSPREQRPARFREHSRYGEVPLLLDGERAIVQSNAILLYLADRQGRWGAETADALSTVREWLFWEANRIGMCLPQLRVRQRFDDHGIDDGAHRWLMARFAHDIDVMERTLVDGRDWFAAGNEPSVADFSLCGYLFFADEANVALPPRVTHWLERLSGLSGWAHPYDLMRDESG